MRRSCARGVSFFKIPLLVVAQPKFKQSFSGEPTIEFSVPARTFGYITDYLTHAGLAITVAALLIFMGKWLAIDEILFFFFLFFQAREDGVQGEYDK